MANGTPPSLLPSYLATVASPAPFFSHPSSPLFFTVRLHVLVRPECHSASNQDGGVEADSEAGAIRRRGCGCRFCGRGGGGGIAGLEGGSGLARGMRKERFREEKLGGATGGFRMEE